MAPQQQYVHGAAAPAVAAPMPVPMAAPMPAPIPQHAVVPAHALAPTPAPARAAAVNWERLEQPEEERTWLQKITPVHMGFLLVGVVVLMIVGSKPGAVKATTGGGALPAIDGGGNTIMPVQPRPTITTPTAVTTAAPKTIRIGTGELSVTAQHGGIPSAAATEAMSATGGGGPSDGVTLPRSSGERDASSGEEQYSGGGGASDELPASPVMTPGSAAAAAERQAAATVHPSAIMTSEMNNSAM